MNPNLPKALTLGIKIWVFLGRLTSLKLKQIFCKQKIKIKVGMQATAIFHKWNHFWRMAEKSAYTGQLVHEFYGNVLFLVENVFKFMLFVRDTKSDGRYIKLYSRNYKVICTR